jgi:MoaA/NifB/PqqE/SkfB family radical SAM enzyme
VGDFLALKSDLSGENVTVAELHFVVDIEPTNRCNAKCHFCPRDATPHEGLMSMDVFEQALLRAAELKPMGRVEVNLCGLGEPLLNKHSPEMVRRIREEGFGCGMSSNGSLLDEKRGTALLEAGLQRIFINVGDINDEYEDVYKLPFEKTRDRIARFAEMAKGKCEVLIVLVDYKVDRDHLEAMRAYWQDFGINRFVEFEVMNRGGALFVDHMQYAQYPERSEAIALLNERVSSQPVCSVPFTSCFVGYDGNFYLCCSDWKKEAPVGNVFDASPFSIMEPKLVHVMSGEPVCKTCNLDPINRMTDLLRGLEAGDVDEADKEKMLEFLATSSDGIVGGLNKLHPGISERAQAKIDAQRKLIPVSSIS